MAVRYMSDLDIDLFKGGAGGLVIGGAPNNPMTGALWLDPDAWAVFTWWTDTDDPLWVKLFDIADPKPPPKTPPTPPGPGPGGGGSGMAWTITNTLPFDVVVITGTPGAGRFPLTSWTGWNPAYAADLTDALLYTGPNRPTNPSQLKIRLFATWIGGPNAEVEVAFDMFPDAPGINHLHTWGYASTDQSIYMAGANSTGNPIQLRLVHTP